jgi:hypothetical protein
MAVWVEPCEAAEGEKHSLVDEDTLIFDLAGKETFVFYYWQHTRMYLS